MPVAGSDPSSVDRIRWRSRAPPLHERCVREAYALSLDIKFCGAHGDSTCLAMGACLSAKILDKECVQSLRSLLHR